MPDARYRYLNDPVFHLIVEKMRMLIIDAQLTPSEVREAAMLACIIEEQRRPREPLTTSDEDLDRMRKVIVG